MKKSEKIISVTFLVMSILLVFGIAHTVFKNYQVNTEAFKIALLALILAVSQTLAIVNDMIKDNKGLK